MALWVFRTCPSVDMSTCLPGLTGPGVNIGVLDIIGIPFLFTCRPVNLLTYPSGLTGLVLDKVLLDGVSPSVFRCTSTPMETGPIDACVET